MFKSKSTFLLCMLVMINGTAFADLNKGLVGCWSGGNGVNLQENIFLGKDGEFSRNRVVTGFGSPTTIFSSGTWEARKKSVVLSFSDHSEHLNISDSSSETVLFDDHASYRRCR